MTSIHRRGFLLGIGGVTVAASAQQNPAIREETANVSRLLANYIVAAKPADLPAGVKKEARRTFLNWMGCALGGSRHETVDNAVAAMAPFSGPAQASLLGRKERL